MCVCVCVLPIDKLHNDALLELCGFDPVPLLASLRCVLWCTFISTLIDVT